MGLTARLATAVIATGCGFSAADAVDAPPVVDSAIDARPRIDADPPPGLCGVAFEPALVLCLDFEDGADDPVAIDGSGRGNDATLVDVTPTARGGSTAA